MVDSLTGDLDKLSLGEDKGIRKALSGNGIKYLCEINFLF